jgi:small-conductance mechanosensitive channel
MDPQEIQSLFANLTQHPLFIKIIWAVLATIFILILVHFAQAAASSNIADKDLRYKTRKFISFIGYLIVLVVVVSIFSAQLGNFTIILGALSVGIGFALREIIQSMLGWIVLSFNGIYKPGDRILMGGIMGDVIDISPMVTTVMECGAWVKGDLYNGRLARLSNSLVFTEHVINYTSDFPFLWDEIIIPVRTDSDYRQARSIIEDVSKNSLSQVSETSKQAWQDFALRYRVEDAKLEPQVTMSFDANWIEFTLRYVVEYKARRSTKDKLFSSILADFDATEGKVQIASSSFQLSEIPPLSVQLRTNNI